VSELFFAQSLYSITLFVVFTIESMVFIKYIYRELNMKLATVGS